PRPFAGHDRPPGQKAISAPRPVGTTWCPSGPTSSPHPRDLGAGNPEKHSTERFPARHAASVVRWLALATQQAREPLLHALEVFRAVRKTPIALPSARPVPPPPPPGRPPFVRKPPTLRRAQRLF